MFFLYRHFVRLQIDFPIQQNVTSPASFLNVTPHVSQNTAEQRDDRYLPPPQPLLQNRKVEWDLQFRVPFKTQKQPRSEVMANLTWSCWLVDGYEPNYLRNPSFEEFPWKSWESLNIGKSPLKIKRKFFWKLMRWSHLQSWLWHSKPLFGCKITCEETGMNDPAEHLWGQQPTVRFPRSMGQHGKFPFCPTCRDGFLLIFLYVFHVLSWTVWKHQKLSSQNTVQTYIHAHIYIYI